MEQEEKRREGMEEGDEVGSEILEHAGQKRASPGLTKLAAFQKAKSIFLHHSSHMHPTQLLQMPTHS